MNLSKTFVFPSKESPKIIGVITIWYDEKDSMFNAEIFTGTYVNNKHIRSTYTRLADLQDNYFDSYSFSKQKVDDSIGFDIQFGGSYEILKQNVRTSLKTIDYDGPWIDPVEIGDENILKKFGAFFLIRNIIDKSRNDELIARLK